MSNLKCIEYPGVSSEPTSMPSNSMATRPLDSRLLFQPFQLGTVTLKNRSIMPAIGTEYAREGHVSERMIRYYERRARGGVGLIHVEFCAVDLSGATNDHQARLDDDRFMPGMRELVERVHAHGVPVVLQLAHAGRQMSARMSGRQPVAPSALPCPLIKDMPRALDTAEVERLIDHFVGAALRAQQVGFEGIQLHGAHGYLLHQFVSPLSNQRTDRFGGSWENRIRFPLQTVERVRAAVGPSFLVGYKISAREYLDGGLTLEQTTELAKRLEAAGIDYLEVSSGTYAHMQYIVQPMLFGRGYLVPFAAHMKRQLRVPVVAVGRINDPELAEDILRQGHADLIAFGRGLLADPDLPLKAERGQFDDIRRCVACNECMSLAFSQKDVACLINPELSREGTIDLSLAPHPKRVLVVGAGPAGIQAALTASQKGHDVVLCERNGWLGGKLPLVSAPPGKKEFATYLRYLRLQIAKSSVKVRLDTLVTPELVSELQPDEVMLASGAVPQIPDIPGVHGPQVFTADDALLRDIPGRRIVVLGASGTGCETAQYLRQRGHDVTVVARSKKAARSIEPITRAVLLEEMRKAGIVLSFGLDCVEIRADRVMCVDTAGQPVETECDAVVLARGYKSDARLGYALRTLGYSVHEMGDAVESRKIIEAVTEAHMAAAAL